MNDTDWIKIDVALAALEGALVGVSAVVGDYQKVVHTRGLAAFATRIDLAHEGELRGLADAYGLDASSAVEYYRTCRSAGYDEDESMIETRRAMAG